MTGTTVGRGKTAYSATAPAHSFQLAAIATAPHLPALDGLRAIAAFSVIVFHGGYGAYFDGVTAFFVLSGFLITTLLLRERESTGTISLRAFYMRRTLRIFPAYYACVAASFAIDSVAGNPWPAGLGTAAVTYLVNYFNALNQHPSTSIAHLWSLGVEEQFYLLWPAIYVLAIRLGLPTLRVGLLAIVIGGLLWKAVLHYLLGADQAYLYNAFDARFDNLAVGCLLATVVRVRSFSTIAGHAAARAWTPLVTLLLMFVVGNGLSSLQRHLFGFTLYSILVAVLIVQLLQLHAKPLWSWLDSAPMRFLGTISYPIYLYHVWGLGLGEWLTALPPFGRFAAGVCFSIAGATGSYYIVERPFLVLKSQLTLARSTRAAH